MKIKELFELFDMENESLLIPVGDEAARFSRVYSNNEEATWLIKAIMKEDRSIDELADMLSGEYEIDREAARQKIGEHISLLGEMGLLAG